MEANVLTTGLLAKTKPEVIDSLNNGQGTFLYNHNIKEVKVIADKEGGIEITTDAERATGTMFQYDSVRVEYPKTADNIFKPRGGHPMGQQEIYEHEASGGGSVRRLYCRLTSGLPESANKFAHNINTRK